MSSSPSSTESTKDSETIEEPEKVYLWRKSQLIIAGYDEEDADLIASDETVDLHEAIDLVQLRHCPPYLAVQILLQ